MKKLSAVLGVAASVSLILLSLLVPVNRSVSTPLDSTLQIADGDDSGRGAFIFPRRLSAPGNVSLFIYILSDVTLPG
jgi:hypothetical protein